MPSSSLHTSPPAVPHGLLVPPHVLARCETWLPHPSTCPRLLFHVVCCSVSMPSPAFPGPLSVHHAISQSTQLTSFQPAGSIRPLSAFSRSSPAVQRVFRTSPAVQRPTPQFGPTLLIARCSPPLSSCCLTPSPSSSFSSPGIAASPPDVLARCSTWPPHPSTHPHPLFHVVCRSVSMPSSVRCSTRPAERLTPIAARPANNPPNGPHRSQRQSRAPIECTS